MDRFRILLGCWDLVHTLEFFLNHVAHLYVGAFGYFTAETSARAFDDWIQPY